MHENQKNYIRNQCLFVSGGRVSGHIENVIRQSYYFIILFERHVLMGGNEIKDLSSGNPLIRFLSRFPGVPAAALAVMEAEQKGIDAVIIENAARTAAIVRFAMLFLVVFILILLFSFIHNIHKL